MALESPRLVVVPDSSPLAMLARAAAGELRGTVHAVERVADVVDAMEAGAPQAGSVASSGVRASNPIALVDIGALDGVRIADLVDIARHGGLVIVGRGQELPHVARAAGADDFVFEPELTASALQRTVRHVCERRRARALVQHLLDHDPVTGAPHAPVFRSRLTEAIDAAKQRAFGRVGVLLIDLDRFDVVNDSFGYEAGDGLLREAVSRVIRVAGRTQVARLHADKMGVFFDERVDREHLVEELRRVLERPYTVDRQEVTLTASMGVASFPADAQDPDGLLRAASRAMRRAKHVGRNNLQIATTSLSPPANTSRLRERFALERDLRRAVEKNELTLFYQPQIDVTTGEVLGVEALVRWERPGIGMVSPADFVPLLEDTGLILPASDWIFFTACRQVAEWIAEGLAPLTVAVNVSATQIRQNRLLGSVENALAQSGLPAQLFEVELTESLLIENSAASGASLETIREMGASISLDDFGTGYSSLSYLKRLPIDILKIDRSFLQEVPQARADAAITSAIVVLAHELGHRVVAEGVESEAQLEFLKRQGCDAAQGFYFSRPLPAQKCFEWIKARDAHAGTERTRSGSFPRAETTGVTRTALRTGSR